MSAEDTKVNDRSVSRGREAVQSFGRGGLGNMRPSSTSRGPENREISLERGRGSNRILPSDGIDSVLEDTPVNAHGHSTGRGGYANITDIKSPDIEPPVHVTHPEHERVSTGRGGAGNIRDRSNSKVRDQPEPHVRLPQADGEVKFSSGRGGAGNIRSRSQSKPRQDEKAHDHKHNEHKHSLLQKVVHPHA